MCRMLVLLVEAGLSVVRIFWENRHQNTRRSRVTAPADLEPPKGVGLGLRLVWVGLVWADVHR